MATDDEQRRTMTLAPDEGRKRWDLLEILFLFSAFLAPLNLRIFRALTAYDVATALLALLMVAGPTRMRWIPSSLRTAGLLLLLAGLAGAFRSTYPMEAVTQVLQYGFVFFVQLPVILTLVRSRTTLHGALMMFILGYLVVVAISGLQETRIAGRTLPFFQETNANALAVPTIFLLPFVVYFALQEWRRRRRLLLLVAGGAAVYLMLWALTASGSRGATAAAIISIGLFVAWRHEQGFSRKVLVRIGTVLVALTAVGGVVFWSTVFPDTLRSRVESTVTTEEEATVVDERLALSRAGMQAFFDSPLIGTGFDNFRYVAQFYDDEADVHEPHNLLIQFLAQAGLVGAVAFVFIIARWFVVMVRARSVAGTRSGRELLWAFIAAMAGVMAHGMLSPVLVGRHYWLLYGLGIAAAAVIARTEGARDGGAQRVSSSRETTPT